MVSTIQSVALGNDVTLEYAEQGDPGGIPVVCLHGVTDSYRSFDPVLPLLPKSFRVFAISQRGHGHSSRPLSGYRYADLADDVHRFMTALKLPSAIIVGHSMGSAVAQRFAIDHPSRTLGLVLAGAFLTIRGDATVEEFWTTTLATMTDPIDRRIAEDFQLSTLAMPVSQAFLDMVVGESLKVPAHVWRATFSEFLRDRLLERAEPDHRADVDGLGRSGPVLRPAALGRSAPCDSARSGAALRGTRPRPPLGSARPFREGRGELRSPALPPSRLVIDRSQGEVSLRTFEPQDQQVKGVSREDKVLLDGCIGSRTSLIGGRGIADRRRAGQYAA